MTQKPDDDTWKTAVDLLTDADTRIAILRSGCTRDKLAEAWDSIENALHGLGRVEAIFALSFLLARTVADAGDPDRPDHLERMVLLQNLVIDAYQNLQEGRRGPDVGDTIQ